MGIATFFGASTASGKIEAVDSKGGSIGYRHWWSDKSRSVIMISNTEADDAAAAITVTEADSIHVNYLWDAAPRTRLGVELIKKDVDLAAGGDTDATRLMFSARRVF